MADENLERITILLQAKDRDFARAMDRNNKLIARLTRDAKKNTTDMASTIDARLSKVSASMTGFASSFAKGLVGGVVAGAFASVTSNVNQVISGVAQIGDEAKRSGLSAKAFQEWKFVAEQNRIGVDQLVDGFKELALRADEFVVTGGGSAAEAFKRLGFTGADLAAKLKDPSKLMLEIVGRLEDMDQAAQIRISDEIFGGSAGERFVELLDQGQSGLSRTIDRAYELGAVLDEEVIRKADELDRRFGELTARIGTFFQGMVVGAADAVVGLATVKESLDDFFGDEDRARSILGDDTVDDLLTDPGAIAANADALEDMSYIHEDLARAVDVTNRALAGEIAYLLELGQTDAALALAEVSDEMQQLVIDLDAGRIGSDEFQAGLQDAATEAGRLLAEANRVDGVDMSSAIGQIGRLVTALQVAYGWAKATAEALPGTAPAPYDDRRAAIEESAAGAESYLAPGVSPRPRPAPPMLGEPELPKKTSKGGGGSDRAPFTDALEDIAKETAALQAEAAALLSVADASGRYADAAEYARAKAELLIAAQQQGIEITPALEAQIDELARGYVDAGMAAEEAAAKLEEIKASGERGAAAVSDIFMSLASGASTAKEALAQLLIEMAKIQMQKAMLGLMESGAGGGIFGAIGSLLGFDGGGYTGNAPRSGGVDGKGGFLAVMHPQETVIDHTKGASAQRPAMAEMARPTGGAQQSRVDVEVRAYVDDNGNLQAMVDRRAAAIAGSTSAATARMQQRTLSQQMQRNDMRGTSA